MPLLLDPLLLITPCNRDPAIRRRMPAAAATPCEWAEGTMFLDACKMDEIGIDYAAAARELAVCIVLAVLAAVAAAVFRKMLQKRPGAAPVVDRAVKNDRRRHHVQRPVTRPTSGSPVDVVDVSKDLRRRRSSDVQCSMHDSRGGSRQTAQSVSLSDSSLLDEAGSLGDVCDSRGSLMCSPQRAAREREKASRSSCSSRREKGQGVVREGSTRTASIAASRAGSHTSTRAGPASMTSSGARHVLRTTTLPCVYERSVLHVAAQSVSLSDSSLLDEAGSLGDVCDSRGSLMCSPQRAAREHEKTSRSSRRDKGQGVVSMREGSTKTGSSAGSNRSRRVGPASMTSLPCIHEGSVLDDVMQKRPKMQKRPNSGPAKKVSSGSLFYADVVQKRCRATVASSSWLPASRNSSDASDASCAARDQVSTASTGPMGFAARKLERRPRR